MVPPGIADGATGSADSRTMSLEPAPKAGSPSSVTFHDSGSHSDDFSSCVIACVLTSVMPALRNWSTAHATVLSLEGKPEMRPHIWPLPTSLLHGRGAREADDGFDVGLDGGAGELRSRRLGVRRGAAGERRP